MSKLVIVESPTKAKTISKILDSSYKIVASMGHVRDLPEREIGVDIENNFTPLYVDTPKGKSIVRELKSMAKDADEIYLAPDPDREGEAIAWHLQQVLEQKRNPKPFHRVTFHEITSSAIKNAMQNKGVIDMNLVNSQQARRILDRIVGYKVSPLLWQKLQRGMSAGRVQSVALRLIVEREREIRNFIPEEYWLFSIEFESANGEKILCKLFKINDENFKISNGADANALLDDILNGSACEVESVERSEKRRFAPPPFTTSTLQQSASSFLHMSPSNTMKYAQALYEGIDIGNGGTSGLITYMRTDSVTIAREAQISCSSFIKKTYGEKFAPVKFNFYKNKNEAQEAHEAIRPTDVNNTPEKLRPYLDDSLFKLYTLIWRRFVASQMTPAVYNQTRLDVKIIGKSNSKYTFRTTVSVPKEPGFSLIYTDAKAEENIENNIAAAQMLNSLTPGEKLKISNAEKEQKFTEPAPHFSEASLIKELEENGIGRPSTYASIVKTILQRNYVAKDKGKLIPTESGFQVNDFLVGQLPELFDVGFTAKMETELDDIESGKLEWTGMLNDFYTNFLDWMDHAKHHDAPDADIANQVLALFDNITFEAPRKIGRRTYDDNKFVNSIREKMAKDGKISSKQYQALLGMMAKYSNVITPDIIPAEIRAEYEEVLNDYKAREAEKAKSEADGTISKYQTVFDAFKDIKWEEPANTRSARAFDEKKFFKSLETQNLSGKTLSEKQLSVLKRMVLKYRTQLPNAAEILSIMGLEVNPENDSNTADTINPKEIIDALAQVTNWADPIKKGRFAFDEKNFYQSVAQQFNDGKQLSEKQLNALKKLYDKYIKNEPAPSAAAPAAVPAPANDEANSEIAQLLEKMAQITTWEPPAQKGRFAFDDKKFFLSIEKQFKSKKQLSVKQIDALKKLAVKYEIQES